MIQTVTSRQLSVNEELQILKNRLQPAGITDAEAAQLPRVCVITGIHGDELEGQFVCYEVARRINEHLEHLAGVVDIYPALNPLGVSAITRGIPTFDLDMNRIFPGNNSASPYESMAADIVADIQGATLCLDIHASNTYLRELPQIRINEIWEEELLPWARKSNVDYIWVHANSTVLKGTLAFSLNALDTPCLVVEMGVGMRLTKVYGTQLADGIMNLMSYAGVWTGPVAPVRTPLVSTDGEVSYINADCAGLFVPVVEHDKHVSAGQLVGRIVDPAAGTVLQELPSPATGLLFTLREYPMVYPGSLIARVLGGVRC
ncbi:MAG: succinylglutamate desuccinylase/aspartoacylase family protein [Eggerthellaceae bacterium]|nr:succinylglutamate desuccinylase/aspartoacylase family protein [Eggerthellaceae bacterium]